MNVGARGWAGRLQHFGARHRNLDGAVTTLFGENCTGDIAIGGEFATKAATNFGGGDADARFRDAQQFRELATDLESPLGARPAENMIIFTPHGGGAVGLEIALMDHLGLKLAFHNHIGFGKAFGQVATGVLKVRRDIGGLVALFAQLVGAQVVMENGGIGLHRAFAIHHRRQHFIFDFDQCERFLGNIPTGGGNRGNRVTVVEHFVVGNNVVPQFA